MAQGKKARPKKAAAKPAAKQVGPRIRKTTRKQARAKAKVEARQKAKLLGSFKLTWQVVNTMRQYWKPLGSIVLVYLILNIVFASGLSGLSTSVENIKNNLHNNGSNSQFINAIGGFGSLIGTAGASGSQSGSVLQSILIVLESLVIIWALRHLLAGQIIGVKEAYYRSMYPLVPFLLVIFVIIVQLLPITLGTAALGVVLTSVFNSDASVTVIFSILFAGLAAWSVYMLSSSVFALYIVTLPDMQPRQALRSAKNLVQFRRWTIMRKLVFLPVFIVLVMAAIIVPLILLATIVVTPVFYLLSMLAILFVHTYLYSLYRNLL
jgi:hypothetical protein